MKLRFKHQKFQSDAAKAVVDVFAGQPYLTHSYMIDRGYESKTVEGMGFSDIDMFDDKIFLLSGKDVHNTENSKKLSNKTIR